MLTMLKLLTSSYGSREEDTGTCCDCCFVVYKTYDLAHKVRASRSLRALKRTFPSFLVDFQ